MKQFNKGGLPLLILGTILLGSSFIINRYILLSDGMNGFIKGITIGLLILSLISFAKQRKLQAQLLTNKK